MGISSTVSALFSLALITSLPTRTPLDSWPYSFLVGPSQRAMSSMFGTVALSAIKRMSLLSPFRRDMTTSKVAPRLSRKMWTCASFRD